MVPPRPGCGARAGRGKPRTERSARGCFRIAAFGAGGGGKNTPSIVTPSAIAPATRCRGFIPTTARGQLRPSGKPSAQEHAAVAHEAFHREAVDDLAQEQQGTLAGRAPDTAPWSKATWPRLTAEVLIRLGVACQRPASLPVKAAEAFRDQEGQGFSSDRIARMTERGPAIRDRSAHANARFGQGDRFLEFRERGKPPKCQAPKKKYHAREFAISALARKRAELAGEADAP